MPDIQIRSTSNAVLPEDYIVPGTVTLTPKQIHVDYVDNSASGDWLPCITFISDAGVVLGRAVDQAVKVTAGDDASVTWFPGVKNEAASVVQLRHVQQRSYTSIGQVIHTGSLTAITFDAGSIYSAATQPLTGSGSPFGNFAVSVFEAIITLTVLWPAGTYDRYIEIVDPSFSSSSSALSWRVRSQTTPDGDIQTVTAVMDGLEASPRSVQFNAFQASGSDKTISRWLTADAIPYLLPPGQNV